MKKINVGLIGLGNVGSELFKMLQRESERFQVSKIAVRDKSKGRKVEVDKNLLTENASEVIFNPNISVVMDVSNAPPENIFERITHQKEYVPPAVFKHYILASKKTMAFYGKEILKFARENNIEIGFEATVCAGIPIIRLLREGHIPERIIRVSGILNGTTNYILSQMYSGVPYSQALSRAQQLGYAEADPTEDVSGLDSAYKLIILCGICFGVWPKIENVGIDGIENISEDEILRGCRQYPDAEPRLLALSRARGRYLTINLCFCGDASGSGGLGEKLKGTRGVENLIHIHTNIRDLYLSGPGAGGEVTAAAMMSDLYHITEKLKRGRA